MSNPPKFLERKKCNMTEKEWIDIFSGNLKSIMNEVGITQNELARDAGLSKSMVSDYINCKRIPNIKSIVNICHALPELEPVDLFQSLVYFDDRID